MKRKILSVLFILTLFVSQMKILPNKVFAASNPVATQQVSASYVKNPQRFIEEDIVIPQPNEETTTINDDEDGGGGGLSTGGIVGIAVGTGGGVAAAGGALALAPVLPFSSPRSRAVARH